MRIFYCLKNFLFALLHPRCWIMLYPYSKTLDDFFIKGLADGVNFTDIGMYRAKFKGRLFWIENHPYASFRDENAGDIRPSRMTVYKLRKRLEESIYKNA